MAFVRITLLYFGSFVHFMRLLRIYFQPFLFYIDLALSNESHAASRFSHFGALQQAHQRRPIFLSYEILRPAPDAFSWNKNSKRKFCLSLPSATIASLWYIPTIMMHMLSRKKRNIFLRKLCRFYLDACHWHPSGT